MQDILDHIQSNVILNNKQRSKIVRVILLVIVIMGFVQLLSDCAEFNYLEKYKDGTITHADYQWNNTRQIIISIIRLALTITCIVFFIMWFRRAFHNLHKLGVQGLSAVEGWAAGVWFVPIYNLYRPYQLVRETWDKTIETVGKVVDVRYEKTSGVIVGMWWLFWILRVFMIAVVATMPRISENIDQLQNRDIVKIFYSLFEMSAGIFAMVMIKRLNYFEELLFTEQDEVVRQLKASEIKIEAEALSNSETIQ